MKLIHPLIILKILSTILAIVTATLLFPLPLAVYHGEPLSPFLLSAAITGLLSASFIILTRGVDLNKFSNRDGYLAVTLAWILLSLSGALPYLISGSIPRITDAFFESASGFSTTGSSILTDIESLPFSILFWRSLTHWVGGIGIIVLVILIFPTLRVSGYQLFSLESSLKEKIHSRAKGIAIRIMLIYFGLTVSEVIFLSLGEMNIFDSVCHAMGTIATGGFSTKNLSLMHYSAYSQYVVMIFMFLAGTSQIIYYYLVKRNFTKIRQNEELWFYIVVVVISGSFATSILMANTSMNLEQAFRVGFFQIVSIITCTGFASADFLLWPSVGLMLIFLLMFSGGSTGSTSGGIKMARHLIVLKNLKNVITKLTHPKSITFTRLNGKMISEETNISILSFIILYLFIFLTGTIVIVLSGLDPVTSATSVATCMAGIGPGLGTVGPMSNFAHLPVFSKLILSFIMIIGRLEIITVFTLFTRSFWKL
ncbi:MAG: TrkH family potassium uptake protein [Bacteroidales bacterium]|jgi:trk system potassium uptake protein TrkH|nr:TrkH family potassium uptake protein [Bacteroidales bacterium]MCU0408586.1 TrkH family potassium uptake protein [Bacteroidales bacterium]